MTRLALVLLLLIATPASAEHSWRGHIPVVETDAEWLVRLDARLVPIHATILDTLALVDVGNANERDAYIVIIQEQAGRGIAILDEMEPAPPCARDYVALERVMLLMWGDAADAWRQFRAGSSQARNEVNALVPAAGYLLRVYGDLVRLTTACETMEPTLTPEPTAAPPSPVPS